MENLERFSELISDLLSRQGSRDFNYVMSRPEVKVELGEAFNGSGTGTIDKVGDEYVRDVGEAARIECVAPKPRNRVYIPLSQSRFLCRIEHKVGGVSEDLALLLSDFTFPKFGIVFNSSEEDLWLVKPSISSEAFSMSGYMFAQLNQTLLGMYSSQFCGGLLSIASEPSITLYVYNPQEVREAETDILMGSKMWRDIYMSVTSKLPFKANPALYVDDLLSEADRLKADKLRMGNEAYNDLYSALVPLVTLERCRFSVPSITMSQSSNEFSKVTLSVSYRNYVQHF